MVVIGNIQSSCLIELPDKLETDYIELSNSISLLKLKYYNLGDNIWRIDSFNNKNLIGNIMAKAITIGKTLKISEDIDKDLDNDRYEHFIYLCGNDYYLDIVNEISKDLTTHKLYLSSPVANNLSDDSGSCHTMFSLYDVKYSKAEKACSSSTTSITCQSAAAAGAQCQWTPDSKPTSTNIYCTNADDKWNIKWKNNVPPEPDPMYIDWDTIAAVWSEANPDDADIACQAVALAAGESTLQPSGGGVRVDQEGQTLDPDSKERPWGIWQSLPSWYDNKGKFAIKSFPDMPESFKKDFKKDPCKQAYLTNQIRKTHCFNNMTPENKSNFTKWSGGPIQNAYKFCNSGWSGNCSKKSGGQTDDKSKNPYYCSNDGYQDLYNDHIKGTAKTCKSFLDQYPVCMNNNYWRDYLQTLNGWGGDYEPCNSDYPVDSNNIEKTLVTTAVACTANKDCKASCILNGNTDACGNS